VADQPKPLRPSRVAGSRAASQRPRKLAGTGRPEQPEQPEESATTDAPRAAEESPAPVAEPTDLGATPSSFLASMRTTWVLVAAIVVLAVASAAEIGWLATRDDPVVSASRPVVTGEVTHRAATDAAQRDIVEILTYGYQDFDDRIAKATSLMTPTFAKKFEDTAQDVKSDFVANKTQQLVKVRGTSVVSASDTQVKALLFLDEYVTKKGDRSAPGTDYTPFRALVTMVSTDHGWLVDNIDLA
jgi:Mce-associated membrane protein